MVTINRKGRENIYLKIRASFCRMPIHHQVWADILWNIKKALEKPIPETTRYFSIPFFFFFTYQDQCASTMVLLPIMGI